MRLPPCLRTAVRPSQCLRVSVVGLCVLLCAARAQADSRSLAPAERTFVVEQQAKTNYARWRASLRELKERTEAILNRPLPWEWQQALTTGVWPAGVPLRMPDLTPKPFVKQRPWWAIVP